MKYTTSLTLGESQYELEENGGAFLKVRRNDNDISDKFKSLEGAYRINRKAQKCCQT